MGTLEGSLATHCQEDSYLSVPNSFEEYPVLEKHPIFRFVQRLDWGTQWELARAIQSGSIDVDEIEVPWILELRLQQEKAPESESLRPELGPQIRDNAKQWIELENEISARKTNPNARFSSLPEAYYGRVHFNAHIEEMPIGSAEGPLKLVLDRPILGGSNRFLREYGSESIIRVKISQKFNDGTLKEIQDFFPGKTFTVWGRHYEAYACKDGVVYLMWVRSDRFPDRPTLYEVLNWHNPIDLNKDKPLAKWASRFQIGHSTTAPGILLSKENVREIDDYDGRVQMLLPGKIATNHCMTDGCGYANAALFRQAQQLFNWQNPPSAIQFRLGGYKGLVLLHPDGRHHNRDEGPTVWLRPSQKKIVLGEDATENQLMFEVCAPALLNTPSRLSPETIVNLAHNGVGEDIFSQIAEAQLKKVYDELTDWGSPHAMRTLCHNILNQGGVLDMRLQRGMNEPQYPWSETRPTRHSNKHQEGDEKSSEWAPDKVSGCPTSIEEAALELLMAGFKPRSCPVLANKIYYTIFSRRLKSIIENGHIPIPMSATVRCAPIPEKFKHLLKEGEVHLRSSSNNLQSPDGHLDSIVLGDGLVTRHPCKVASDVQKVKFVNHPELFEYTDIILMPIDQYRSMASMLGGGDYDGDTILVIWDPEIVDSFTQPSPMSADPPTNFDIINFIENDNILEEELFFYPNHATDYSDQRELTRELQRAILKGITTQNLVGKYSVWHDKAVSKLGYNHPDTIRLAYMFCTLLDSGKSGKTVHDDALRDDRVTWDAYDDPEWKKPVEDEWSIPSLSQKVQLPGRTPGMQDLRKGLIQRREELKEDYKRYKRRLSIDEDLCRPWQEEWERANDGDKTPPVLANFMRGELEAIRNHIQARRKECETCEHGFTKRSLRERQDRLLFESNAFDAGPVGFVFYNQTQVKRLRASYAYIYDSEYCKDKRGWSQWPWNVAFRDLCDIKTSFSGAGVTHIDGEIAAFLKIDGRQVIC